MEFSFRFIDNDTLHNDLVLKIGDAPFVVDSYYLALNQQLMPDQEDATKVRAVLRRLLTRWADGVVALSDKGCVYLPYEFSDQFTRWIICRRDGERVLISRGYSTLEGWRLAPSMVEVSRVAPPGLRQESESLCCEYSTLVESIQESLKAQR